MLLHEHKDFDGLIATVSDSMQIDPTLVEKDYWIMHSLWGLQQQKFKFELKGGTSLSKGFGLIHRFSEDIDIRIEPPIGLNVKTGKNQDKEAHIQSRAEFYDWFARTLSIPGVQNIQRDHAFDEQEKIKKNGKAGDADNQFLLWLLYVNDLSISKPKAYVWIKKAAFNKQPRATFGLGLLYYYGYIVPEQKSKAIKLFKESSALGYSFGSTFLNK